LEALSVVENADSRTLEGRVGAVANPPASVRVWPLDNRSVEYNAKVNADGSFSVGLPGPSKASYRIHAENDQSFSAPLDFSFSGTGPVTAFSFATDPCIAVVSALDYGDVPASSHSESSVTVVNTCDQSVKFTDVFVKYSNRGFKLTTTLPLPVLAQKGDKTTVSVKYSPTEPGVFTELLVFETNSGRKWTSLRGFSH